MIRGTSRNCPTSGSATATLGRSLAPDITFKIGFYGSVDNFKWSPGETVSSKLEMLISAGSRLQCIHTAMCMNPCRPKVQP